MRRKATNTKLPVQLDARKEIKSKARDSAYQTRPKDNQNTGRLELISLTQERRFNQKHETTLTRRDKKDTKIDLHPQCWSGRER